jgi:hypothetical protein
MSLLAASPMVLPFHEDPYVFPLFAPFAIVAVGLVIGLLLRRGLDLVLEPDDSRRRLVADAIMYGGIALAFAASFVMHSLG